MRPPLGTDSIDAYGSKGQPPEVGLASARKYLSELMIGDAAPSPSAQNDLPRMASEMSNSVPRSSGTPGRFQALVDLRQPVGALPARRAFAARLVGVELRPAPHRPDHTGGLVEDLQRRCPASTRPRPYPRSPTARRGVRRSAAGWTSRPVSRTSVHARRAPRRRRSATRAA